MYKWVYTILVGSNHVELETVTANTYEDAILKIRHLYDPNDKYATYSNWTEFRQILFEKEKILIDNITEISEL